MARILGGGVWERIKGGWKTVGAPGVGAFDYGGPWVPTEVGPISAIKLSAYFACIRLLSECMGSMTFQLYDGKNNVIEDHGLYGLLRARPNLYQTGDAFVSAMAANNIMFGNSMSKIDRLSNGEAFQLDFYNTELWEVESDRQGRPSFFMDRVKVPNEDVLHWPGFGMSGYWGIPTLLAAGHTMAMQVESNDAAAQTFANGLRVGGFFTIPENKQAFNDTQLIKFNGELAKMSRPENTSKWLPLLPGMGVIQNTQLRIDPVTAELLQSRYFGIEEICRYMGVPPPLIGHTDKASSWASSLSELNQFLVDYTLLPKAIRFENVIAQKLLGRVDRNRLKPKLNMDALLRGDIETRFNMYEIGREQGILSANDARDRERLPRIPGGDDYTPTGKASKEKKDGQPA